MQNKEHNKRKDRVSPPSSLARLESYLRTGENIDIRIIKPLGQPVAGKPHDWERFQIAQLVPYHEKFPELPCYDQDPKELVPDEWFAGNTIAACLLQLVAHMENERPLTEDEARLIAHRISKGDRITSVDLDRFKKYMDALKVERI